MSTYAAPVKNVPVENIVKRELSATMEELNGDLFMDGEEYIIDGTGGSESRSFCLSLPPIIGSTKSIVSTESERFPNSPEDKSFNSLLSVRSAKMEELKNLLAQHATPRELHGVAE
jgi:hypothetical protein